MRYTPRVALSSELCQQVTIARVFLPGRPRCVTLLVWPFPCILSQGDNCKGLRSGVGGARWLLHSLVPLVLHWEDPLERALGKKPVVEGSR